MVNILLSNIWNIYGDVFQLTWVYFIIYEHENFTILQAKEDKPGTCIL